MRSCKYADSLPVLLDPDEHFDKFSTNSFVSSYSVFKKYLYSYAAFLGGTWLITPDIDEGPPMCFN